MPGGHFPPFQRSGGDVQHEGRIGVIDIGSNSIRLVVYDGVKRAPLPLFNEKIFCGLGKNLASSGKLNPEGIRQAEACMKRFLALVRVMDVVELQIMATAAVRDAQDGAAFVEKLERTHRININVISGKKEARLAAAGIFSSVYKPQGLAGDMGGGSIELIGLEKGSTQDQTTLPIGPLRIMDLSRGDKDKMRKLIAEGLAGEKWLEDLHPEHFYAIGGSFRALAHIHMQAEQYPLDIVHHYTIKTNSARKFLKEIQGMSAQEIAKLPGAPAKRMEALIPAAYVLEHILDITEPADVIFSASGIREGYLFEKLSPTIAAEDPLIASCTDLASQNGRLPGYPRELFSWMSPLFEGEDEQFRRLRFAACIISEIAWRIHPDARADWAFFRVIQSTLTGLSHSERVALALAMYYRYRPKRKDETPSWPMLGLIREKDKAWARTVGAATNLAFLLSGGNAGNLSGITLDVAKLRVELEFSKDTQDLLADAVKKRLDGLGEAFRAFSKLSK